jgi:hypothetical protein
MPVRCDMTRVCQPNEHTSRNFSKYGGQKPNTHCNTLSKNVWPPAHNKERQRWAMCRLPSCKLSHKILHLQTTQDLTTQVRVPQSWEHDSVQTAGTALHGHVVTSQKYKYHILQATTHFFLNYNVYNSPHLRVRRCLNYKYNIIFLQTCLLKSWWTLW